MDDFLTYQIEVLGQVNQDDLNAISPIQIKVVKTDQCGTKFTITTDQSGLIGLMRHLNGRGFVILSVLSQR